MAENVAVRQARADDADAVAAFTRDTWAEFDRGDYLPSVFPEWVAGDGPDQRTFVAERGANVVGCCQAVRLSAHEAWTQGMRVHPDCRGEGVAAALDAAALEWARNRGAAVARNMVFSWNEEGTAAARALGYEPRAAFRWARPDPAPDRGEAGAVADAPDAAWACWARSDARDRLGGLALDDDESWALSEWTRERCRRAADERAVLAVRSEAGTRAAAARTRTTDTDDGTVAVYGASCWRDLSAARALFAAIARDAAACDATATRVLVPETPRHVSDATATGAAVDDHPDLVFEADLTARRHRGGDR
jgi:GNAT superfamily N-acetyltransferase